MAKALGPLPRVLPGECGRIYFHLSRIRKEKITVHLSDGFRDNAMVFLRCPLGVAHRKGWQVFAINGAPILTSLSPWSVAPQSMECLALNFQYGLSVLAQMLRGHGQPQGWKRDWSAPPPMRTN